MSDAPLNSAPPDRTLESLLAGELDRACAPPAIAAARHVAERHGKAVLGVLFYGSCLRTGVFEDRILDFYVLVSDYRSAYDRRWLALGNRLLPPNVFYDECTVDGLTVRSKYNILSLEDFRRQCRGEGRTVSIWARFAQPCALLCPRDDTGPGDIAATTADAVRTALASVLPLCPPGASSADVWSAVFTRSYGAELRAEPPDKGREIYALDAARYDRLFAPALASLGVASDTDETGAPCLPNAHAPSPPARRQARRAWRRWRFWSKTASLLRLVKGAFSFDGGLDYLAWKIGRHAGVKVTITPWQRRHPILGGLSLYWRLRRRGAFR